MASPGLAPPKPNSRKALLVYRVQPRGQASLAEALATKYAGALAFSRTSDPDSGSFADTEVIAVYGAVDTGTPQG